MENCCENFLLNKRVKIFQPIEGYHAAIDAVLLAAAVNKLQPGERVLDVGSGTGAVSLCLAARFNESSPEIIGAEIQPFLVTISNKSAAANQFDFVKFYQYDISSKKHKEENNIFKTCFDYVLTNPPYAFCDMPSPNQSKAIAHNLRDMTLSGWIDFCLKRVKAGGRFCIINRAEALPEILQTCHKRLGGLIVLPITSFENEPAKRVIITGQKNSRKPATVLPPLIMHLHNGEYTPTAEKILREAQSYSEAFSASALL